MVRSVAQDGPEIAQIGGDFLQATVGGKGGFDGVLSALDGVDNWIKSHQDEIKDWFTEAANGAKQIWQVVHDDILPVLELLKGHVGEAVLAFGAFKTLGLAATIVKDLDAITTGLGAIKVAAPEAATSLNLLNTVGMGGGILNLLRLAPLFAVGAIPDVRNYRDLPGGDRASRPQRWSRGAGRVGAGASQRTRWTRPEFPGVQPDSAALGPDPYFNLSHATGGITRMPHMAVLQSAVHPAGLVNWAEPSTGGEAFIPLSLANRERSLGIWTETGKRLGVGNKIKKFDQGGLGNWWGMSPSTMWSASVGTSSVNLAAVHSLLATLTGTEGGGRTPYVMGGFSRSSLDCCLVAGTMVWGPDGPKPIDKLRAGDRVYSYEDGKLTTHTVKAAWFSNAKTCTGFGRSIVPSPARPTTRSCGW